MKKTVITAILSVLLLFPALSSGMQEAIDRNFDSKVWRTSSSLGFTVEISEMDGGTVLTIPEQMAYFLPLEKNNDGYALPSLGITFTGSLPGTIIFSQNGYTEELSFSTVSYDSRKYYERSQEKKRPGFEEKDVTVTSGDGAVLAGTLTLPVKDTDTCVIFITGSGLQDRDSTIANHRTFMVLSDEIVSAGFATLRFDDRGIGQSTGSAAGLTTLDLARDTEAEIGKAKELGFERIILLGHSEGGIIAPVIASMRDDITAIILLAPPAVSGREILLDQNRTALASAGTPDAVTDTILMILNYVYDFILEGDYASAVTYMTQIAGPAAEATVTALSDPWYRTFIELDPADYLSKVKCPVLAIIGTKDTQVSAELNGKSLLAALDASGSEYEYLEMGGINHLMQKAVTGLSSEYGFIDETVNQAVLDAVTAFIKEVTE
ncbi:MAG: alpha/beta hydrolase [Bullifex sp.]